ncbi:MAG TPA: hypothetical protein VKW78_06715 [Terriglobales bacterium]|nr:hypothetical protein [Terriglobales bacterium]
MAVRHRELLILTIAIAFTLARPAAAEELACTNCHGEDTKRVAAPDCGSCHVGTALQGNEPLRYSTAFRADGTVRQPSDKTFSVNLGKSYTTSIGHGGLKCTACHGDPHAEPHMKLNADCAQCHRTAPDRPEGPHGMHPAGQAWVHGHMLQVDENGAASCMGCHGSDGRGTVLSQTLADRNLNTKFGPKHFPKGMAVGCYSCHTTTAGS